MPEYRTSPVSFTGDFSGPFGSGLSNTPIPSHLIEKLASDEWTTFKIRQSIAAIDDLLTRTQGSALASVQLPGANNLILVLQGKIYTKMACNRVLAEVPISAFSAIQSVVRNRLLDLTLELERNTNASDVTVSPANVASTQGQAKIVNNIAKQVIQGNSYTTLIDSRGASQVIVTVQPQDLDGLHAALTPAGFDDSSATELAQTVAEDSVTEDAPIGATTGRWLKENATGMHQRAQQRLVQARASVPRAGLNALPRLPPSLPRQQFPPGLRPVADALERLPESGAEAWGAIFTRREVDFIPDFVGHVPQRPLSRL